MSKRLLITILISNLMVSVLTFSRPVRMLPPEPAFSQEEGRVVGKLSRKLSPLKIRKIKTKKGEIFLEKEFLDNGAWFRGLSVALENISGKTITYISAGFLFPRKVGDAGKAPPLYKSLHYGQNPDAPEAVNINRSPLALKPGERIAVTLSDYDYFEVKNNLQRLEYGHSINTIKFNIEEVYFDDGTSWIAGTWFAKNPNRSTGSLHERQPFNYASGNPFTLLSQGYKSNNLEAPLSFFFEDEFAGNMHRPDRAAAWVNRDDAKGAKASRWAWDVFLVK